MKHWHNKFYALSEIESIPKRYTWVATAITTAAIGGGVALYEGSQNRDAAQQAQDQYNAQPQYIQLPDYSESTQARQNWAQTLGDWGSSGTYGANLPNYDKIFENAKRRIGEYYWGSASNPGVMDKIRASGAARNVENSPAVDVLSQRSGVEEANKLGDVSTSLDTTKANAIETARSNWLQSLTQLASLKPSFMSTRSGLFGLTPAVSGLTNLVGTAGAGIQDYYQNQQNQAFTEKLFDKYLLNNQPQTTQSSLLPTDTMSGIDSFDYWGGIE